MRPLRGFVVLDVLDNNPAARQPFLQIDQFYFFAFFVAVALYDGVSFSDDKDAVYYIAWGNHVRIPRLWLMV